MVTRRDLALMHVIQHHGFGQYCAKDYLSVVDVTELAAQQGCQAFRFLHGAVDDLCCPVKRMLRSMSKRWNGSHRPYGINGYRGD